MDLAENTAPADADSGYLTVAEFAAMFRVEPATIYAAIAAGEIEGVIRVGRRRGLRIPRSSCGPYVQSRLVAFTPDIEQSSPVLHPNLTPASSPALPEPVVLAERADEGVVHAA